MEKITVKEAASILNISPQAVRVQMDRGILKIGKVVPSIASGQRKTYLIYRELIDDFMRS